MWTAAAISGTADVNFNRPPSTGEVKSLSSAAQLASSRREAATLCLRREVHRQRLALGGGVDYVVVHTSSDLNRQPNRPGDLDL